MKWLNLITKDEVFTQLVYELFDSEEDLNTYKESTVLLKAITDEKMKIFNETYNKIEKYANKIKRNIFDIIRFTETEFLFPYFEALDKKISKEVDILNETEKYSILYRYINTSYEFSDKEKELIPELKEIPTINYRFVNSIQFGTETSWEKLKVPEELRHAFVVAMVMRTISEDII